MSEALKNLYGPAQLTASAVTLYTVPASTTAVLRYIRFNNTTGTDRTVTISIGTNAADKQIFTAMNVPSNGSIDWTGAIVLTTGVIIQGLASAATAITVVMTGIEIT